MKILTELVWVGPEFCILTHCQVMSMLLVSGSDFKKQGSGAEQIIARGPNAVHHLIL